MMGTEPGHPTVGAKHMRTHDDGVAPPRDDPANGNELCAS